MDHDDDDGVGYIRDSHYLKSTTAERQQAIALLQVPRDGTREGSISSNVSDLDIPIYSSENLTTSSKRVPHGGDDINNLISLYFSLGLHQKEMIRFLEILHGKTMSLRTLKRRLSKLNLFRRRKYTNIEEVVTFLESELNKSGQLHGYKWMHLRCLQNNLVVTQHIIRDLLKLLDPQGVQLRQKRRLRRRQYHSKGPNYLWHVDSYDKLKPYGICINGCIDGFSRHIIWLKAGPTASNPKVIAGYFVEAMKLTKGCPEILRSDMGTENGVMEKMQKGLHELFDVPPSSRPCFIYGKSTHNQRIEAWWSTLRKHNAQYWMNLFQMLKEDNLFTGSFLDKSLIQFCFMALIQSELDQVSLEWNVHRIRKTKNAIAPAGRPAIMYEMPSLYGVNSHLLNIPLFVIESLLPECTIVQTPCDKDFYDLCSILMVENNLIRSSDPNYTIDLYIKLRSELILLFE